MRALLISECPIYVEYYWFEGRGRGRVARFWPNTSSRRIRQSANLDSFSGAILSTDYGENFLNMRNKGKVYKNFETILSRKAFKSGVNPDFMPYLRLASNGYTSNRLLGKEQDKNLNLAGVRILKEKGLENVDFAGDVRAWADMATSEGRLNPAAFLKMITAERLVNDKALLANLHTVDELKKAGYEVPEFAEPVMITKKGEELYDLSSVYSTTARVTPSYALLGDKEINANSFKDLNNIENMSGFICPDCGKEYDIFGKGTTQEVAKAYGTKTLAQIPIEPSVREAGDSGKPIVYFHPESKSAKEYLKAAKELWDFIEEVNDKKLADNSEIQPINTGKSACSS